MLQLELFPRYALPARKPTYHCPTCGSEGKVVGRGIYGTDSGVAHHVLCTCPEVDCLKVWAEAAAA